MLGLAQAFPGVDRLEQHARHEEHRLRVALVGRAPEPAARLLGVLAASRSGEVFDEDHAQVDLRIDMALRGRLQVPAHGGGQMLLDAAQAQVIGVGNRVLSVRITGIGPGDEGLQVGH